MVDKAARKRDTQRRLMHELRRRRAEMGLRAHQVWAHDDDWPLVREYAGRLLLERLVDQLSQLSKGGD